MIILVQSCLLRHGFISAVGVRLNDCQFVIAASFSMYKKRISSFAPFNSLPLFLAPLPFSLSSIFILLHLNPPSPRVFNPPLLHFSPVSPHISFLCSSFLLSHPCFLPFHLSFLICSFSRSLITQGVFCLAAPPPLSVPPLISLLASSSNFLDLVL